MRRTTFSKPLRAALRATVLSWSAVLAPPGLALAQDATPPTEEAEPEGDPTDPRSVELETDDGVLLVGTYYPADEAGRDTPVVVMLADEDESPAVFDRLAFRLQMPGVDDERTPMAVLTIAVRGQGDSTRVRLRDGTIVDRRGAEPTPADAAAMVKRDMEAVRRYLVEKNDDGELNLNRLGYLGVGQGALVAVNAAAVDWSMPELNRGKQGRDVKALVLVSPPWKRPGLQMLPALRQPGVQTNVSILLTYGGEDADAADSAKRIVRQLEKARSRPAADDTPSAALVDLPGRSRLQGSDWLKLLATRGEDVIADFFQTHLADPELPWVRRRID